MAWTRLDDNFDTNPKLVRAIGQAGDAAGWLWVRAVNYCNRHLTDGRVPRAAVPTLTSHRKPFEVAEALVSTGVFELDGEDYRVHDFLQWNDSREKVLAARAALKARKDAWNERRRNASDAPPENAFRTRSERVPIAPQRDAGTHPSPLLSDPGDKSPKEEPGADAPLLLPVEPTEPTPAQQVMAAYVEGWKRKVRGTRAPVLTEARKKLIQRRLKDGLSLDDLLLAARGIWLSEWNVGNGQHGFDLVFRDVAHVEKFRDLVPRPQARVERPPESGVRKSEPPPTGPPAAFLDALRGFGRGPQVPSLAERQQELRAQAAQLAAEGE